MTGTWMSLAIEVLVVILLVVTIGYCIILNSRLKRLKSDETGLRKTITELVLATEIAERAINGLKVAAVDCDNTLAKRVREAEYFSIEIAREVDEGKTVLDRIAQITRAASGHAERRQADPTAVGDPVPASVQSRADELKQQVLASTERLASLRRAQSDRAA